MQALSCTDSGLDSLVSRGVTGEMEGQNATPILCCETVGGTERQHCCWGGGGGGEMANNSRRDEALSMVGLMRFQLLSWRKLRTNISCTHSWIFDHLTRNAQHPEHNICFWFVFLLAASFNHIIKINFYSVALIKGEVFPQYTTLYLQNLLIALNYFAFVSLIETTGSTA